MLYQIYDWQRSALEPWRAFAQAANEIYGHPNSPFSYLPGSRNVAAAFDLMTRLTQRYERPEFGITSVTSGERRYAVKEVVDVEKPFCHLLHFVKVGAPKMPRVIVFAPLSGHFATLLRDTVKTLLTDHDVWVTDWIDAKEIPISVGPFHFDDYVAYVREFITFMGRESHAISVCQPTVPVMAAVPGAAAYPASVKYRPSSDSARLPSEVALPESENAALVPFATVGSATTPTLTPSEIRRCSTNTGAEALVRAVEPSPIRTTVKVSATHAPALQIRFVPHVVP